MEITDKEHKRAVEIEAELQKLVDLVDAGHAYQDNLKNAREALEPVYKPFVSGWPGVDQSTLHNIGATYLEAAANRIEDQGPAAARVLLEWAKAERAIGS